MIIVIVRVVLFIAIAFAVPANVIFMLSLLSSNAFARFKSNLLVSKATL